MKERFQKRISQDAEHSICSYVAPTLLMEGVSGVSDTDSIPAH
ncbi:hypothetical protein A2U01_0005785 [Trifolium medium]|uniref:Uncharacterized protein n=1 Tax=Trifolium medium TaxID=97028 RepID=A0A392MBQ4_9FABA|nr:hypothetical protein [Trifolium medium]